MSLELVKDMFGGKPIHQIEKEDKEDKEKTIKELEKEADDLSNQVLNLESENNNLMLELNKARYFENGAFSVKEKDYINKIKSKENLIKEIKSEFNSLYKKIDKQKDKLHYAYDIIKKYTSKNKELNEKINRLNHSLNFEKKNNKEVISEINAKVNKYANKIKAKDDIIEDKRQELLEDIRQINNLSTKIDNLQTKNRQDEEIIENLKFNVKEAKENEGSFILEINNFKNIVEKKDNYIVELKKESKALSRKVVALSVLDEENSILQKKLQEAESFQNIIVGKKDEFEKVTKEINDRKTVDQIQEKTISGNVRGQGGGYYAVVKTHYGLEFDGNTTSLNTEFAKSDKTPINRTYSWWMKSSTTGGNEGVFGYGSSFNTHEGFHLNRWLGRSKFTVSSNHYAYFSDISAQDDGLWHHWMVSGDVEDPSQCKLYVDTEQIEVQSSNTNLPAGNHSKALTIGAGVNDTNDTAAIHFAGSITNFAIFTGDKTGDVVAHYNNGIPKDLTGQSDLEGYWKMDEGTGMTAKDYSGNGNDGELDDPRTPEWVTVMKETNHIQSGITYMENLTTGKLEDPRGTS